MLALSRRSLFFLAPLPIAGLGLWFLAGQRAAAQNPNRNGSTLGGPVGFPTSHPTPLWTFKATPSSATTVPGTLPGTLLSPTATAAPTPTPPPTDIIRVGVSTQGGALGIYLPGGAIVTDGAQAGRELKVPAGAQLQFSIGPNFSTKAGTQTFTGPISFSAAAGGLWQGWQVVKIKVLGDEPGRATSNGSNPRWGRPFRGDFEVFPQRMPEPFKRKGPLALVNVVGLEDYLKGVVPWEMSPSAPLEALKAQAICARTKALDFVRSRKFASGGFDVCDYDACQGYPGTENEKPATSQAVEQTAGLALFQNGVPIDAVYSTNSGGITAAARDVWKSSTAISYLESVPDFDSSSPLAKLWKDGMSEADWAQFCSQPWPSSAMPDDAARAALARRRRASATTAALYGPDDWPEFYRWKRIISTAEAQKAFSPQGFASVESMSVVERTPSGRIRKLKVTGFGPLPANSTVPVTPPGLLPPVTMPLKGTLPVPTPTPAPLVGPEKSVILEGDAKIRAMFSGRLGSTTALPSSLFVITPQTDASGKISGWVFQGAGWGHGVGMCQRGAQNHARTGWDARRILNFYFRNVQLLDTDKP